jgi:DNA-binding XRE family transcriptional regulator
MRSKSAQVFRYHAKKVLASPDTVSPLKLARVRAGLTQEALGELANVSRHSVLNAEKGHACQTTTIAALEEVLKCT